MYITVSRHGVCFWDDQQCATRCEENSKVYVERVPGSEHGFQHLTEREDMIVLCLAAAAPSYSSILPRTSHCILDLCLCFRFRVSLLALSSLLSSQLFFLFGVATLTTSAAIALGPINLCKCTQLFVTGLFFYIPKCDRCLRTSHTFNCIPKWDGSWGSHPANQEHLLQD